MKALLLSEYSKLDVTTEMPRPVPGPGELLIASLPAASAAATCMGMTARQGGGFRRW